MAAIKTVGVIGAGQMGNGIAHVCALAGYPVMLNDISADRIKAGMATINGNMTRQVSKELISDDARKKALDLIKPAEKYDELASCDLVIESATEKEEVKRKIFADLCTSLKPDAIIATNTSSISITRLASSTDRPERFIGIHFMNPVPLMELVELIRGIATDDQTFEVCKEFITRLGKTIAVAEDFPAFIVNRILLPMINEAIYTLYEGVGNVESIDTAMRLGAHHPMGPLELADFIGLDTCLSVMQVLYEGLADSKYRPCPLLVKYVEAGWLGRKAQRGFYDYRGEKPVGGARGDGPAGMAQHEAVEPLGGREAEASRQCRLVPQQGDQLAHREPARRHHHRQRVAVGKLQQPRRCAFDQAVVVDRAARARGIVERLEGDAEACAQGLEVDLLAQMAGDRQHPVGTDADRRRPLPDGGDGRGRQQPRHAVEFRVAAWIANARARAAARPSGRPSAGPSGRLRGRRCGAGAAAAGRNGVLGGGTGFEARLHASPPQVRVLRYHGL